MASDPYSNDESAFPPPPEAEGGAGTAPGAASEAAAAAAGADSAAGAGSSPGAGQASPPPPPMGTPGGASGGNLSQDERNMALFCHLSTFLGFVIPLGNIIAPLVLWLIKKDSSAFVDHHGREALNFQINVTFWMIVFIILSMLLIGLPFLILLAIADVVLTIVATVKAANGEHYEYPLTLRLVK
ncbi:MAG: DUF4870 domain-containing protein [Acidobacteriota bacterium]|nr:DUF4870 domain-containing protein [Acidobacteriota bacterium]